MTAYYNEYEPFAAQWLRNLIDAGHLPPGDVDSRSILDVQPEDLAGYDQCHFFAGIGIWGYGLRRFGWADDNPIWSGSCPCQPFSAAGRGLGFADERHLWPAWFHLITQRRPARIVGEQVASADGLGWFDLVSTDLENAGYAVGAADLCAAGFAEQGGVGGGFHLRQRLYFTGIREGVDDAHDAHGGGGRWGAMLQGWHDHDGPHTGRAENSGYVTERGVCGGLAKPRDERRREAGSGRPVPGERAGGASEFGNVADATARGLGIAGGALGAGDVRHVASGSEEPSRMGHAVDERNEGYGRFGGVSQWSERSLSERFDDDASGTAGLADAERGRREMASIESRDSAAAGRGGATSEPRGGGATGDRASGYDGVPDYDPRRPNANLAYCRDGRWRPIEPGSLPLAHAVPRSMAAMRAELRAVCVAAGFGERDLAEARKYRSGALKAFGNALDAETVVAFLEAALPLAP